MRRPIRRVLTLAIAFAVVAAGVPAGAQGAPREESATPQAAAAATRFGTNLPRTTLDGERLTPREAFAAKRAKFGVPDIVRVYFGGRPTALPELVGPYGGPVVVSFKESNMRALIDGSLDAYYARWFRSVLPRGRRIYWVLWHEPEDEIALGHFTAAQYVAAYRRLDRIADATVNAVAAQGGQPLLLSTTAVLMRWTVDPASGRRWRDYFPGSDVVDVLAWDVYITGEDDDVRRYLPPQQLLAPLRAASNSVGVPWALAEFGSVRLPYDRDDTGRAGWLRGMADHAATNGALFVAYWDSSKQSPGEDLQVYELNTPVTRRAWRAIVEG